MPASYHVSVILESVLFQVCLQWTPSHLQRRLNQRCFNYQCYLIMLKSLTLTCGRSPAETAPHAWNWTVSFRGMGARVRQSTSENPLPRYSPKHGSVWLKKNYLSQEALSRALSERVQPPVNLRCELFYISSSECSFME